MKYTLEQAENLIAATNEAGKRSRQLAYFIGIFTVFAFIILWDSGQWGWVRQRHEKLSELEARYDHLKADQKDTLKWADFVKASGEADFFSARTFIRSEEQLKAYKELHDDLLKEALVVEAPILGITFDINNFPLFYGFSFLLLMAIMRVNLEREQQFQEFTLGVIGQFRGADFTYLYHLLAMGQVLTNPGIGNKSGQGIWEKLRQHFKLQHLIYYAPTVVMLFIVLYDRLTAPRRSTVDYYLGVGQFSTEVGIFCGMAFLSWVCFKCVHKMDKNWMELNAKRLMLENPSDENNHPPQLDIPKPDAPTSPDATPKDKE